MIEAAEARGPDRAGPHDDRRGHERQHRHRARVRVRRQGLRPDPHAPAGHEPRARGPAAPLRRPGARHRVDGRHERGGRRRPGAGARRATSGCPTSSPTPPTPRRTAAPPARRSGRRSTASVDYLVAGVGTGGTITGAGALPEGAQPGPARSSPSSPRPRRCSPAGGPGRTRSRASARASSRRCSTATLLDEIIAVDDEDAIETARLAARREGVLCRHLLRRGAVGGAARSPQRPEAAGKRIAVVLPDSRRALRLDAVLRARARARRSGMSLREVEGPAGAPWERPLHGTLDRLVVESELLADNPLGDPARRPLYVYRPPGRRARPPAPAAERLRDPGLHGPARHVGRPRRRSSRPSSSASTRCSPPATARTRSSCFVDAWTSLRRLAVPQLDRAPAATWTTSATRSSPFVDERYPTPPTATTAA